MTNLTPAQKRIVAAGRRLQLARADAIQSYADLEQALCELFSYLSDTNPAVAGTIFFRITNARSRSAILDKLMHMKHKANYRLFFNSLLKMLGPIEEKRNGIIHWHMLGLGDKGPTGHPEFREMALMPPNFWTIEENTPSYNISRLNEFQAQCDFMTKATRLFVDKLNHRAALGVASPDIFQQSLEYPPPAVHPLAQMLRSRGRPRSPSRA
jgi:hypothetical protein